jgi:hypothetical protein
MRSVVLTSTLVRTSHALIIDTAIATTSGTPGTGICFEILTNASSKVIPALTAYSLFVGFPRCSVADWLCTALPVYHSTISIVVVYLI